jgi:sugar phosphate isomerase/epimerase
LNFEDHAMAILPISIQIYSLRSLGSLDAMLDCVKEAGFRHVELIGSQLDDATATRRALDARGLAASSSHVGIAALREKLPAVLAACKALGFTDLYMPAVPAEERHREGDYWLALGIELGDFARRCANEGVRLGYHNHHWELEVKSQGKTALDLLWQGAADSPLAWQMDAAWMVRGKADPQAWMQRFAGRITAVHAKDLAPAGEKLDEDGWADVGHGTMDWPVLARAAKAAGATWLVAEHDKPNDPTRFARNSHAYLEALQ